MSASIRGIGLCMIPNDQGVPCGRQVAEGESIGTVLSGGPQVGHKKCADAFHARRQAEERQKRSEMVKIGKQQGPGGDIGDPSTYPDALASGSYPLEKPLEEKVSVRQENTPDGGVPAVEAALISQRLEAALSGNATMGMTPEEMTQLEQYRQHLLRSRMPEQAVVRVDLTGLPAGTTTVMLQLELGEQ